MSHPDDAILWKVRAPRLLDHVPRPWIADAVQSIRAEFAAGRRIHQRPEITSFHPFVRDRGPKDDDFGVNPGMSLIVTKGPAQYHTDGSFPRFFYLLILHSRSYCVDGGMWPEPFEADQPGDLICLDSHRHHGLRASWHEGPEDLQPEACRTDRVIPNFWLALSMESWASWTPEQTITAYDRGLKHNKALISAKEYA
ncbi:hypothetical protein CcrBL47_gp296 [Caulobacter phage BL47]|nr:hypothetical protein CcrBL47_gp296 [Caulobacter phage BL47]